MKFCSKCGGILIPDKDKKRLACGSCNKKFTVKGEKIVLTEDVKKKAKVEVVDNNMEVNPKVDAECPKCGHGKAYFWSLQTRASDEGETRFFKCTKCDHRWRQYE